MDPTDVGLFQVQGAPHFLLTTLTTDDRAAVCLLGSERTVSTESLMCVLGWCGVTSQWSSALPHVQQ